MPVGEDSATLKRLHPMGRVRRPGFSVKLPSKTLTDAEAPSVFLDFGRELTGRVEIVSDSDTPAMVTIQMGESEAEALKVPFLGINQITVPPHETVHGPKTAFRYGKVRVGGRGR